MFFLLTVMKYFCRRCCCESRSHLVHRHLSYKGRPFRFLGKSIETFGLLKSTGFIRYPHFSRGLHQKAIAKSSLSKVLKTSYLYRSSGFIVTLPLIARMFSAVMGSLLASITEESQVCKRSKLLKMIVRTLSVLQIEDRFLVFQD